MADDVYDRLQRYVEAAHSTFVALGDQSDTLSRELEDCVQEATAPCKELLLLALNLTKDAAGFKQKADYYGLMVAIGVGEQIRRLAEQGGRHEND